MLRFCNSYPEDVWVAYMFYSPQDCGGEGHNWQKIGWFHIRPGACTTVYANDLDDVHNRYWYFYAETAGAAVVWTGPISVHVSDEAFDNCLGIATTTERTVGFREIDVGDNENVTIPLTP